MTARSIAMGGAFTAEKDHGFATFNNPAWAAFLTNRQVGLSYSSMSLDRRLSGLNFATPLPPTAGLGIAWVSAGVTDIQGRNSAGEKTTMMQTSEDALMISFAQRILPWFSFGANNPPDIIVFNPSSTDISVFIVSDCGIIRKNPEVGFGVVGTNK